jgi:nitrite reductase/ring-hydroxylating ferredoxin subunit
MKGFILACLFSLLITVTNSCESDPFFETIPPTSFNDIFINLSLPEYQDLFTFGYIYINVSGNSRGIILYRDGNSFRAFERTCSFDPSQATALVDVNNSGTAMIDYSCSSIFSFADGFPEAGPAQGPLRLYEVIQDGSFITITDTPIN